jgi:hypothetical protein
MKRLSILAIVAMVVTLIPGVATARKSGRDEVRFATFNASLNRFNAGDLIVDLSTPDDAQAQAVAEIIQRTRPDVLLVNEFDFDENGEAADLFRTNYLEVSQNGADPIDYRHVFVAPSNTGIPSGFDLNNDGTVGGADDAFGFGFFPGQFGMAVFSKYPIDDVRTFQNFLWKDMPGALLPTHENGDPWYSEEELDVFRLSSKSHWDLEIEVGRQDIHFLVSHPTPPVFDGPEDRNGTRNHDEIRFWADYIHPRHGRYIYDDEGDRGGIERGEPFVIAGDQNSDPLDGDSIPGAIQQLTESGRINTKKTPVSTGGVWAAETQGGINTEHLSDPAEDTADFGDVAPGNLRADYVLPSKRLRIADSAVFWPAEGEEFFYLTGDGSTLISSDHRLVWVDVKLKRK